MYVTLDISTNSIRFLSVKGRNIQGWENVPLAPGLVRDGVILQPKAVGAVINDLFKTINAAKERVIVTLTGLPFTYRILSLPRMKPASLQEAIQRGARKEMPLPLEELYLSWQAIGSRDNELDFFVLGVPRNLIDTVVETLAEAAVKPYLMDIKPLALARAANRANTLIVALEPDCFDIVLVTDGVPAIMHTITPRGGGANIEDNIRRLTDELSRTVQFYNSSHPENPFSSNVPLLLTGELSTEATRRLVQAGAGYPVEFLIPEMEFPPDLPTTLYATNIGLALKRITQKAASKGDAALFHDINLNVLSGKYEAKASPIALRRILLPVALIVAAGLLFPLYQAKSQADVEAVRLQTELERVGQELRQVRLATNEAEQTENTINEITANVEALKQEHQYMLSRGGDFSNNLQLVTDNLPPVAYFTSVVVDSDKITVEGEADSSSVVIDYVAALEALDVFSEVRIAALFESNNFITEATESESTAVSFTIVISKSEQ